MKYLTYCVTKDLSAALAAANNGLSEKAQPAEKYAERVCR